MSSKRKKRNHDAEYKARHDHLESKDVLRESCGAEVFGFFQERGGLAAVHEQYLSGQLNVQQCLIVDEHLLGCRRCENHWDALTLELEEGGYPIAESSSDDDEADFSRVPLVEEKLS